VNKLLILATDADKYLSIIENADLESLEVMATDDVEQARLLVEGCNIMLGAPLLVADVLEACQQLEWVQSSWAGVDQLCKPGLRRDYVLTGAKGIFGAPLSEYVMTYLFALERQLFTMRDNQLKYCWRPLPYRPASEIKLGIIGLGSIGRHLAGIAASYGIQVTGLSRSGESNADVRTTYTPADLAVFLEQLDYVVLTLPDTASTRHFINTDTLKMMKASAVLINVGRGSVINEADLIEALGNGVIAGAVLDVFEKEPLDENSPLWSLPNVYITPHTAATSFPEEIAAIFIENYQRFLNQQSLLHQVDFELGY
jgi:phosphoglycerate dehydrogenase-like enzyme